MTDEQIIRAHYILADAENLEDVKVWGDHWGKHLSAFSELKANDHSGDCTKQPWSCLKCHYDEAVAMVPVYRAIFNL